MRKTHRLGIIFLIICLFTTARFSLAQDNKTVQNSQESPVIKVNTELVSFDVQVLNKTTSNPVGGLTEKDFEVYEDNVKQTLTNFSQDKLPLSVLLLVDVSGSVEGITSQIHEGTIKALNALKSGDEFSMMAFASGTGALEAFTTDKKIIIDNMEEIRLKTIGLGQQTRFYEALKESISHIKKFANPNYRKVVVAITDNVLNAPNKEDKEKLLTSLLEAGITVNCILVEDPSLSIGAVVTPASSASMPIVTPPPTPLPDTISAPRDSSGRSGRPTTSTVQSPTSINTTRNRTTVSAQSPTLSVKDIETIQDYVSQTGGEIIDARRDSISNNFIKLVEHLRARYSLGYVPSNTKNNGKLHKLTVKIVSTGQNQHLKKEDLVVKTKKGYFPAKEK